MDNKMFLPFVLLLATTITFTAGKPGACPDVPQGTGGICLEDCVSDDSCPGKEKCCSNGCGHTCQRPANLTCPQLNCDRNLDCGERGYKLDEFGCAMCECYVNPCPLFKCRACPKYYNYRNIGGHTCRGCECVSSIQCPSLECQCPPGYLPDGDINGCPTCRCVPSNLLCPIGGNSGISDEVPVLGGVPYLAECPPMSKRVRATNGDKDVCCKVEYASASDQPVCNDGRSDYSQDHSCGRVWPPAQCPEDFYCSVHELDGWAVCCPKEDVVRCPIMPGIVEPNPILDHVPSEGCPPMSRSTRFVRDKDICCKVSYPSASDKPACDSSGTPYSDEHTCGLTFPPSKCPEGMYCSAHETDRWAVCCPRGCPLRLCTQDCTSGFTEDEHGCQTCECVSEFNISAITIAAGALVFALIVLAIVGIIIYRYRYKKRNIKPVEPTDIVKEPLKDNNIYPVVIPDITCADDMKSQNI